MSCNDARRGFNEEAASSSIDGRASRWTLHILLDDSPDGSPLDADSNVDVDGLVVADCRFWES